MRFAKVLDRIGQKTGDRPPEVWRRYLTIVFACLSYGTQEDLYHEAIKPYKSKPEILDLYAEAFGELVNTYQEGSRYADHLGDYHMSLQGKKSAQATGEYFTPMPVAELIASLTGVERSNGKPIKVLEPACGSGRMVLAKAKILEEAGMSVDHLEAEAWDVTQSCFFMAYINMTLWAIPARVVHGNTLTQEVYREQETILLFKSGGLVTPNH